jgi:hypothetical protein
LEEQIGSTLVDGQVADFIKDEQGGCKSGGSL